jgi:S1-C subfamily serine protease
MMRSADKWPVTLVMLARLVIAVFGLGAVCAQALPPSQELEERIIEISERVKPSVVHVEAIIRINDRRNQVMGSGLIASESGLILTNQHVVEKSEKVEVSVPGKKKRYPAKVTDRQTDIAVLQIQPEEELRAAVFGTADDVRVGQWVLAIGNPYGLEGTVSFGIVSAKGRNLVIPNLIIGNPYGLEGTVSFGIVSAKGRNLEIPDLINDFIQTDAMIDHGSSGGPLVDLEGRVIGINSRGKGRGIGFTIPIDTALEVMAQIQEGGIERGWLGLTIQPLNRDLASYFGFPAATGVIVNGVIRDSPAARAKLAAGDIITAMNGVPVEAEKEEDLGNFQRRVAHLPPGETAKLEVLREGKRRTVEVRLGTQPKVEPTEAESDLGFHVQEITENLFRAQRLASRSGAYVSFVARGSPAAEAGLRPGDVIEAIGESDIGDLEAFRHAMKGVEEQLQLMIRARRGDDLKFLLLKRGARPVATAEPEP